MGCVYTYSIYNTVATGKRLLDSRTLAFFHFHRRVFIKETKRPKMKTPGCSSMTTFSCKCTRSPWHPLRQIFFTSLLARKIDFCSSSSASVDPSLCSRDRRCGCDWALTSYSLGHHNPSSDGLTRSSHAHPSQPAASQCAPTTAYVVFPWSTIHTATPREPSVSDWARDSGVRAPGLWPRC